MWLWGFVMGVEVGLWGEGWTLTTDIGLNKSVGGKTPRSLYSIILYLLHFLNFVVFEHRHLQIDKSGLF